MQGSPGNPVGDLLFRATTFSLEFWFWLLPLFNFLCALMLMLLIGNPMIDWLRSKRWKKGSTLDETWTVREDTPDSHQLKQGTPSMGGIGIVGATLAGSLAVMIFVLGCIYGPFTNSSAGSGLRWNIYSLQGSSYAGWILMPLTLLFHALLGFADDWSKASGRGGLRARTKLAGQLLLSLAFITAVMVLAQSQSMTGVRYLFFDQNPIGNIVSVSLGFGFLMLVMVATGNAVNLTDGIDGLAAGLAIQCGIAFFFIGSHSYEIGQLSIFFWVALAGACLGFLKFNRYKARVFMGDTGSLAIGAALGAAAILQHAVFLLPFIAFMYFVEMASVTLQVLWFKYTKHKTGEGKRLFRRAPLHHHFELGGWSEWRVVLTFWAVNLLTSAIGLVLWHLGIIPRWP